MSASSGRVETRPHRRGIDAVPVGQLLMMAKVARMYHERGMRQTEIAEALHISQPRVSRLLKQAVDVGVVRTSVVLPPGLHCELEERLTERYGLRDVVVVDGAGATDPVAALGVAAAGYLETTLLGDEVVGISSWSATLLETARAMHAAPKQLASKVVQLVGGLGHPDVQIQATRLVSLMAELTRADPVLLQAPAFLDSAAARDVLMRDGAVKEAMAMWDQLTVAVVGIGSLEPSPLLRASGNAVGEVEQAQLRVSGAVGDACLRFFDEEGQLVPSDLHDRIVGIRPEQLRKVPRCIGVAGGRRKTWAIRAALRGRWINVLITDLEVAEDLLGD